MRTMAPERHKEFWTDDAAAWMARIPVTLRGLSAAEAEARALPPARRISPGMGPGAWRLLLTQFFNSITLLLLISALLSLALGQRTDAAILLGILLASGGLGFWQEYAANRAMRALLLRVQFKAMVRRDGAEFEIPFSELVPGDLVLLNAGDAIPADGMLVESRDLFVDESALSGEAWAREKRPGASPAGAGLSQREGALFLGSHVLSGTGCMLCLRCGLDTIFGALGRAASASRPETSFERGLRRFSAMLLHLTFWLLLIIFAFNVILKRDAADSLMFALALAVGLTPQLLPAVVAVNLARGARRMAESQVIVRRLASLHDFGGMDLLCTDKTGTLTEGRASILGAVDAQERPSPRALSLARLNARHESGFSNPIDEALRAMPGAEDGAWLKLDEIPYDFSSRRLSVLLEREGSRLLIAKGAVAEILEASSLDPAAKAALLALADRQNSLGLRVLGVASKDMGGKRRLERGDVAGLNFEGLLLIKDQAKAGAAEAVAELGRLGVKVAMITGDRAGVALAVAKEVGLDAQVCLTGGELRGLSEAALQARVEGAAVFAEIEPDQKERILRALRARGRTVGYLGDGVNDAPALRAADVGISVDTAVDAAKEAADIVLLRHDLGVLAQGVGLGRVTLANTMKYLYMASSANFGNMLSVAGASLFLPFLPLLPKQILLANLLTDFPEMAISGDRVDPEMCQGPLRWELGSLRRFMFSFGVLSSLFDFATFALLLRLFGSDADAFRTGWFMESAVSAALVVLLIRTRRRAWQSLPSPGLAWLTLLAVLSALLLPYSPLAGALGFKPLPALFLALLTAILLAYGLGAEALKSWIYLGRRRS